MVLNGHFSGNTESKFFDLVWHDEFFYDVAPLSLLYSEKCKLANINFGILMVSVLQIFEPLESCSHTEIHVKTTTKKVFSYMRREIKSLLRVIIKNDALSGNVL